MSERIFWHWYVDGDWVNWYGVWIQHQQQFIVFNVRAAATAVEFSFQGVAENFYYTGAPTDPEGTWTLPPQANLKLYIGTTVVGTPPAVTDWTYGTLAATIAIPDVLVTSPPYVGTWTGSLSGFTPGATNYLRIATSCEDNKPQHIVDSGYWPLTGYGPWQCSERHHGDACPQVIESYP